MSDERVTIIIRADPITMAAAFSFANLAMGFALEPETWRVFNEWVKTKSSDGSDFIQDRQEDTRPTFKKLQRFILALQVKTQ